MRKGIAACLMAIITVGIALEMRTTTEQMGEKAEFAVVKMGSMTETTLLSGKVGYIDNQPCVAMRNGIISKVHVKAGQEVEKGDLLFTLETAQEERALADVFEKMYFQQNQSGQFGEVAQVFNMSAQSSTGDLMLSVASSRIRASADGVVENVYVEAGSEVSTSQLLGNVHGNEIGLVVETKDYTKFTPGMRASAQIQGETLPLVLKSISVSNPLQASATLCFSAEGVVFPEELLNRKIAVEVV